MIIKMKVQIYIKNSFFQVRPVKKSFYRAIDMFKKVIFAA